MEASDTQIRDIRGGKMSMIFQEPMSALNPSMRIDKQMIETIRLHQDMTKEQAPVSYTHLVMASNGFFSFSFLATSRISFFMPW